MVFITMITILALISIFAPPIFYANAVSWSMQAPGIVGSDQTSSSHKEAPQLSATFSRE